MSRAVIIFGIALTATIAGLQAASAAPFCIVGSLNFGIPDCSYRTWAQCRIALGGVGDYCEPNTRGPYVFDLRDPAHPRVVGAAPRGRYRNR